MQVVLKDSPTDAVVVSDQPFSEADRRALVDSLASGIPPLRVRLQKTSSEQVLVHALIHHALYDGASLALLWQSLRDALEGRSLRNSSYSTMASQIHANAPADALAFWKTQLQDVIPTRFPNLTGQRKPVLTDYTSLDVDCSWKASDLRKAAAMEGVTPQVLLASKLFHLLGSYISSDDVLMGLVLNGRHWPIDGIAEAHGPFMNVVPVRCGPSERQNSKKLQQRVADVFKYQLESLSRIQQSSQLIEPPFDTLMAFTETDENDIDDFHGALDMDHEFPLAFEFTSNLKSDRLHLLFRFSQERIPRSHAEILLKQLDRVITASDLDADLLSVTNPKPVWPSAQQHFLHRFIQHAKERPQAEAIRWRRSDGSFHVLSYEQLDAQSNQISARLASIPYSIIAVYMERRFEWYALILAIWKAGKAYLPLDIAYPEERVAYMVETVGEVAVITSGPVSSAIQAQILSLEEVYQETCASESGLQQPLDIPPSLDLPAYIMFTSGSTGKPKGVSLSHRALAAALLSWDSILPHTASSRMLQLASPGFDVSLIEICMPLGLGFSLASAEKDWLLSDLSGAIIELGITISDLPAALVPTIPISLADSLGELYF